MEPRAATIQTLAGILASVFSIAQDFPQHISDISMGLFMIGCFDLKKF
jgi:hypothetical protein